MAIRVQLHTNDSKQATLLDGVDVGPLKWRVYGCGLNRFIHEGMNNISNVKSSFKDLHWKRKYLCLTIISTRKRERKRVYITRKRPTITEDTYYLMAQ